MGPKNVSLHIHESLLFEQTPPFKQVEFEHS